MWPSFVPFAGGFCAFMKKAPDPRQRASSGVWRSSRAVETVVGAVPLGDQVEADGDAARDLLGAGAEGDDRLHHLLHRLQEVGLAAQQLADHLLGTLGPDRRSGLDGVDPDPAATELRRQ